MAIERIHGADALRGIAATGVVLHHLSHIVYKAPEPTFYFITSHLGLGVPLFFCISAFSMYHAYFNKVDRPGFQKAFLVRRYARLLPLFLLMFALWSLLSLWPLVLKPVSSIVAYLTMTFALIPQYSPGYVPAAWSLGVEMLFYFMFPLMIILFRTVKSCAFGLFISIFLAFNMQNSIDTGYSVNTHYFAINPILFIPCFFLGAMIWLKFNESERNLNKAIWTPLFAGAGLLSLIIAWWISVKLLGFFPNQKATHYGAQVGVFLIAFSVLLYGQVAYPSKIFVNSATQYLGKISYSIYLLHPYILMLVKTHASPYFIKFFQGQNGIIFTLDAIVTFAVLIPLSAITYRFIEVPGVNFGRKLAKKIEYNANKSLRAC